jgi:hypothetical protein
MNVATKVVTIAGNGTAGTQGPCSSSVINKPFGICCSDDGKVYVADATQRIRLISQHRMTTIVGSGVDGFCDGHCSSAQFNGIDSLCYSDEKLYISDSFNHLIRVLDQDQVTTFAGNGVVGFVNGQRLSSQFSRPSGICMSNWKLYVSD